MRSSRLVQLSFVICAAAFALSGCGITLMTLNQQVPGSQAAVPATATAIATDAQGDTANSNRWKHARLSIKRLTRRGS